MKRYVLLVVSVLMLASCGVYHPQMMDIPLIAHRGDGHLDINLSPNTDYSIASLNTTVSYGLTDRIAVQGAVATDFGGTNHIQLSIGTYRRWDSLFVGEVYVGGAYGTSFNYDYDLLYENYDVGCPSCYYPPHSTPFPLMRTNDRSHLYYDNKKFTMGTYTQLFVQANAGWVGLLEGVIDIGLGIRMGMMDSYFTHYGDYTMTDSQHDGMRRLSWERTRTVYDGISPFAEPMVMLRVGGEHFRFVSKMGYTFVMADFDYSPLSIACGINYRF